MSLELAKDLDNHSKWIEQECQNRLNSFLVTISILFATSATTLSSHPNVSAVLASLCLLISILQMLLGRRQVKYLKVVDIKLDETLGIDKESPIAEMESLAIYHTRTLNHKDLEVGMPKLNIFEKAVTNRRLLWGLPILFLISSMALLLNIVATT